MNHPSGAGAGDELLDVDVQHEPGAAQAVVRVEGEVDTASAGELDAALERAIGDGATELRLDLEAVPFMDSTGLTSLISARAKLEGRGRVVIDRASPAVRRTVEVAGLTGYFLAG